MAKNYEAWLIHSDGRETKITETWQYLEAVEAADMAVQSRVDCRAVVVRWDADPLAKPLYEVESPAQPVVKEKTQPAPAKPAKRTFSTTTTVSTHITTDGTAFVITFDRITKDLTVTRNGETVGMADTLPEAMTLRNDLISQHITSQERAFDPTAVELAANGMRRASDDESGWCVLTSQGKVWATDDFSTARWAA